MQQHALIVRTDGEKTHGLDELNLRLQRGWRVVETSPLGGAGTGRTGRTESTSQLCLAALVIVEREQEEHAALAEQVEEEPEEIVEEIVEGNGAEMPEDL